MSNTAAAMLIGLLAGAHIATWNLYRDSPYEGLVWSKYFRNIMLGPLVGLGLQAVFEIDLSGAAGWVVFFGLVYAVERLALALWERAIPDEDST